MVVLFPRYHCMYIPHSTEKSPRKYRMFYQFSSLVIVQWLGQMKTLLMPSNSIASRQPHKTIRHRKNCFCILYRQQKWFVCDCYKPTICIMRINHAFSIYQGKNHKNHFVEKDQTFRLTSHEPLSNIFLYSKWNFKSALI